MIAAYALYSAYLGKLFAPAIDPARFRDFGILMDFARAVAETGRYPHHGVYYPPPCMIAFDLLQRIGPETSFRLHLVLQALALCFAVAAWERIIAAPAQRPRAVAALIAVIGASFAVHVELRMHNINMLSLALVSAAVLGWRRAAPAGLLLATTLAIKPSGAALLLPWMAWHGAGRWLAASVGATLLFTVALPVMWFGASTTVALYADWLASLAAVATPAAMRGTPLSLQSAVAATAGADVAAPAVAAVTRTLEAAWLALVVAYFAATARPRGTPAGERLAAQVGVLLIAPLPIGPLQQPGRGVVLLVPLLVLATALCDRARPQTARIALGAIIGTVALLPWAVPVGPFLAGSTLVVCALTLAGLAVAHATAPRRRCGRLQS